MNNKFIIPIVIISCIALIGLIAYRLRYPLTDKERDFFSVAELILSFFASGILLVYASMTFMGFIDLFLLLFFFISPLFLTLLRLGVVYTTGKYDTELSVAVMVSALFSGFYNLLATGAFR